MVDARPLDLGSDAFKADPFATYARLRDETPVLKVRAPMMGEAVLVTRYDDVAALLKNPLLVKDPANAPPAPGAKPHRTPPRIFAPLTRNMLGLDDPDHARLKRLVQRAFSARRVDAMVASTEANAHALIDAMMCRPSADLIEDFAMPLPVTVISDLLGVPEADRDRFARGSRAIIAAGSTNLSVLLSLPQVARFLRYLNQLIALKRRDPQDDLTSELVQANAGDRLDHDELLAMLAILLSAGHETTTNLIGNGVLALLGHPDQLARLRDDGDVTDTAVEELLRFGGPAALTTPRYTSRATEIAGFAIPQGTLVFGAIASANRDEHRFAQPDRLDLGRNPNRHLSFGEGGHYCVGAALARMEARIAFPALLTRLPSLRVAVPPARLQWRSSIVLRGLKSLPVTFAR